MTPASPSKLPVGTLKEKSETDSREVSRRTSGRKLITDCSQDASTVALFECNLEGGVHRLTVR